MNYDFVIIGAGFAGCVLAERIANLLNKTVLIIERRNHIGGNCFDYFDENGILVHKYGPHIFHTKKYGTIYHNLLIGIFIFTKCWLLSKVKKFLCHLI